MLAAIGSAAWLVWSEPYLNLSNTLDMALIVMTWATFFVVAAVGIERCFEPMPTLAATPQGLVLFPTFKPKAFVAWDEISSITVSRFGPRWLPSTFLDIAVEDPSAVARHLPIHLKIAYRIDRWMIGDTSYYRPRADFEKPLNDVAAELEAWRLAYSTAQPGR